MITAFVRLIALCLFALVIPAEDVVKRTIMVAPFENLSAARSMVEYEAATSGSPDDPKRRFKVDRYSEAPRGILEDILVNDGRTTVIERQRVDSLLQEQQFSGLSDPAQAVALGKIVGAQYIVLGTIQDVSTRQKAFSGYGVAVTQTQVTASIRIRVIDVETGGVVASRIVDGSEAFTASQFGGTDDSDVAYKVLVAALAKAKDESFLSAVAGARAPEAGGLVAVIVEANPPNCDVLIDGVYVGGSPQTISLPAGRAVQVTIRRAGFRTWESKVIPRADLRITPELEASP